MLQMRAHVLRGHEGCGDLGAPSRVIRQMFHVEAGQ